MFEHLVRDLIQAGERQGSSDDVWLEFRVQPLLVTDRVFLVAIATV